MGALEGLSYGLGVAMAPQNILAVFLGSIIGTAIGVLPGIGPVGAMAILLPVTLGMHPETAIIMLAGIYYGSLYGGSTTSILVNVPGEAASVVTARDGYEMAKRGRAGAALAVAAVGSFIAGTIGIVIIMFFAPFLANLALKFGAPEFFVIALLGLFALSRISGGSIWYSLIVMGLGLTISTVGLDPISSVNRFTMGILDLTNGIELVPVVMGLFGVAEVLSIAEQGGGLPQAIGLKFKDIFPTRQEWKRAVPAIFRGTATGLVWGLIPGPSPIISTFASYRLEQQVSKHREEFGKGAIEGVAGPESANNAASSTAMVPILSLGIPFTPATAMLLACLMMQGIQPGPLLMTQHAEIFWGVIASMYVGNAALLILNYPLVGLWVTLLRVPQSILLTLILLFTLVGTYALNNRSYDLIVLVVFGFIGYLFRKIKFDAAPLIVALVLGQMMEEHFRTSLVISYGNPWVFFLRPISGTLLGLLLLILIAPPVWKAIRKSPFFFRTAGP